MIVLLDLYKSFDFLWSWLQQVIERPSFSENNLRLIGKLDLCCRANMDKCTHLDATIAQNKHCSTISYGKNPSVSFLRCYVSSSAFLMDSHFCCKLTNPNTISMCCCSTGWSQTSDIAN